MSCTRVLYKQNYMKSKIPDQQGGELDNFLKNDETACNKGLGNG